MTNIFELGFIKSSLVLVFKVLKHLFFIYRALQNYNRTEAQWMDWTDHVFELEDINKNMISNDHRFLHSLSKKSKIWVNPTVEWYWKCLICPLLLRFASGLSCAMSIIGKILLNSWCYQTIFA